MAVLLTENRFLRSQSEEQPFSFIKLEKYSNTDQRTYSLNFLPATFL